MVVALRVVVVPYQYVRENIPSRRLRAGLSQRLNLQGTGAGSLAAGFRVRPPFAAAMFENVARHMCKHPDCLG